MSIRGHVLCGVITYWKDVFEYPKSNLCCLCGRTFFSKESSEMKCLHQTTYFHFWGPHQTIPVIFWTYKLSIIFVLRQLKTIPDVQKTSCVVRFNFLRKNIFEHLKEYALEIFCCECGRTFRKTIKRDEMPTPDNKRQILKK